MIYIPKNPSGRNSWLEQEPAECLQSVATSQPLDQLQHVAGHSKSAEELTSFFVNRTAF